MKTATFDETTHKIVPIEPTIEMLKYAHSKDCVWTWGEYRPAYKNLIDAAPLAQQASEQSQEQPTDSKATYCLGYTHDKCESCKHGKTWHNLNGLPDWQRLPIQTHMTRINSDKCRMTNMGQYLPTPPEQAK